LERILIVEDSKVIAKAIQIEVIKKLSFLCEIAHTLKEATEKVEKSGNEYFIAILDLNLPDTREGEIVDYFIKKSIPSIVFTASFNGKVRDKIVKANILDYVLKENPRSIEYLINIIHRIYKNQFIKVLVVDDSVSSRKHLIHLLKDQRFKVLEAGDGWF
jgi:CheY-like chemotaxis protein